MNLKAWLAGIWPREQRFAVVEQYRLLGKLAQADIALRGSVWNGAPPGLKPWDAGVFEGRRQMAVEILLICGSKADELFDLVPRPSEAEDDGRNRYGRRG